MTVLTPTEPGDYEKVRPQAGYRLGPAGQTVAVVAAGRLTDPTTGARTPLLGMTFGTYRDDRFVPAPTTAYGLEFHGAAAVDFERGGPGRLTVERVTLEGLNICEVRMAAPPDFEPGDGFTATYTRSRVQSVGPDGEPLSPPAAVPW